MNNKIRSFLMSNGIDASTLESKYRLVNDIKTARSVLKVALSSHAELQGIYDTTINEIKTVVNAS
jgi:hypothetical protein